MKNYLFSNHQRIFFLILSLFYQRWLLHLPLPKRIFSRQTTLSKKFLLQILCFFLCLCNSLWLMHANPQPATSQWKAFSSTWILICRFNSFDVLEANEQFGKEQRNGLSPVWVRMWTFRLLWLADRYEQPGKGQRSGFSPVWIRKWVFRIDLVIDA